MARRRVKMDMVAFASDFASGMFTQADLAAMYGLSKSSVEKIVHGRRRPEVRGMIEEARRQAVGKAQERLKELLGPALRVLDEAMGGRASWGMLSAAKVVLHHVLGRPARAGAPGLGAGGAGRTGGGTRPAGPVPARDLTGLPPALRREVQQALGFTAEEIAASDRQAEEAGPEEDGDDEEEQEEEEVDPQALTCGRTAGEAGMGAIGARPCGPAAGAGHARPGGRQAGAAGSAGGTCPGAGAVRAKTDAPAPAGRRPMPARPAVALDRHGNPVEPWEMPEMTRRMLGLDATPPAGTAAGTAAGAVAGTVTGTVTGAAAGTVAGNVRVRAGQERAGDAGRYRVGRDLGAAAPLGRGLEKRCRADKTRTMAPARRGHGRGGGERAGGKAGGGGKR